MNSILVGFEIRTGKEVSLPLSHMVIAGKSGTGKSHLMKGMIDRASAMSPTLIFDIKSERDFLEFPNIPLYIVQNTNAMFLKNLLESSSRMGIKQELPELSHLCRKSSSIEELVHLAKERQNDPKVRAYYKDRLEILILLLEPLLEELSKFKWSQTIELTHKANVMDLSTMSRGLQQIIVASVFSYIMKRRKNIITCLDEAHRFIPQKESSAARLEVVHMAREGRSRKNFLWIADQTITGIEKDAIKQVDYYILGRQTEPNEAKKALEHIAFAKSLGLKVSDIQTLGLGEFIVVTPKWVKKVYALPTWLSRGSAIKVAKGEMTAEEAAQNYEPKGDQEDMTEEKYSKLKEDYDVLEADHKKLQTDYKKLESRYDKLSADIKVLTSELKELQGKTKCFSEPTPQSKELSEKLDDYRKGQKQKDKDFTDTMEPLIDSMEIPESVSVETEQPKLTIIVKVPPLNLTDADLIGKIAICYAEGNFPKDKWFTSKAANTALIAHGWEAPRGSHTKDALDTFTRWGYLERKMSGKRPDYRLRIHPEEAEDKGLLETKVVYE